MDNIILIDWLSFTTRINDLENVKSILGLKNVIWQELKGMHGYQDRIYFESISIHYNGRPEMGIWVEMSGQGCRAFETYGKGNFIALFTFLINDQKNFNITRLDVAYDDHIGLLDINKLCDDCNNQNFVSLFYAWQVIYSSGGNSILHGSKKSEILIRIYDKAKERKCADNIHWVRLEIQLRRQRAAAFLEHYILNKKPIGILFSQLLNTYLHYVVPSKTDTNKRRWETADYWASILTDSGKIKLFKKLGVEYNLINLYNFVIKQCGNSLDTYIKIVGVSGLLTDIDLRKSNLNKKYTTLIANNKPHFDKMRGIFKSLTYAEKICSTVASTEKTSKDNDNVEQYFAKRSKK